MAYARRLLSATKRNTTNILTSTQADSPTTANGWTAGGTSTCVAGATPGPFGFGVSALFTAGASGARTLVLSSGTFSAQGNKFSVFLKPGTCTTVVVGLNDTTAATNHYGSFTNTAWVLTYLASGWGTTGVRVQPYQYDNGWTRLEVEFVPGANGGGATIAGNTLQAYLQINGASATCEIWGAHLEAGPAGDQITTVADGIVTTFAMPPGVSQGPSVGTAPQTGVDLLVTDNGVFVDHTAAATRYKVNALGGTITFDTPPLAGHSIKCSRRGDWSTPYMVGINSGLQVDQTQVIPAAPPAHLGLRSYTGNELPFIRPQRIKDEQGIFYTEWLNTPSGAMKLQGRSASDAPWFDLVSITQASLNASGQYATLVALMPEIRLIIPTLGNTTTTMTAWLEE